MKKFAILSALAISLSFTSCDENPVIDIPVNPQPEIFSTENLAVTAIENAGTIDIETNWNEGLAIPVGNVAVADFPEDYQLKFVMEISKDEQFSKVTEVATTYANDQITVNASDLQSAYVSGISKGPKERTIYARYAAYAVKANTVVRLGDPAQYWGPFAISVLPIPGDLVIEDAYYLVGTACNWDPKQAIKLEHAEDVSVYDDPVFSVVLDIPAVDGGWWWKIIPQSSYESESGWGDQQYGVEENGDDSLAGMLVAKNGGEDPGAGCLSVVGPYTLKINMEEMTYEYTIAINQLYTPGSSNGWNQGASQILTTNDFITYTGVAHLNGEFKFTSQADWNGINYGSAGEEGMLSTDGGAGNLNAGADGLYWCSVNLPSLTYELSPINTLGLIGDFNGWASDVDLTPSADFLVWKGSVTLDGGSFKVRANDDWVIDFGGTLDNVVAKGANINSPGAGTYNVELNFSAVPYTMTLTAQ